MQRLFNRIKLIWIGFCLVLGLLFVGVSPVQAQVTSELPVVTDSAGQQTPAWDRVSFSLLPAFDSAGVLNVPEDATGHLDYNLSRSWQTGDSVLNVLKLGDVQDAFALGNFRLGDAVRLGGLDPATLSLSNFSFLQNENIADLMCPFPPSLTLVNSGAFLQFMTRLMEATRSTKSRDRLPQSSAFLAVIKWASTMNVLKREDVIILN